MKTIVTAALFSTTLVFAQEVEVVDISTPCVDQAVMSMFVSGYKELPLIRGSVARNDNTTNSVVLFVNSESRTFSIIERVEQDKFCILASGVAAEVIPQQIRDAILRDRNRTEL